MTFRAIEKQKPGRTVELQPGAFAETSPGRPPIAVVVGLRRLSQSDVDSARSEAEKRADQLHPEGSGSDLWIEAYNDALRAFAVARGTCMPHDVAMPMWEQAEDTVQERLTAPTIAYLFDEIDRMTIEASPIRPEIAESDAARLASALVDGEAWAKLDAGEARSLRRVLGVVAERMGIMGEG